MSDFVEWIAGLLIPPREETSFAMYFFLVRLGILTCLTFLGVCFVFAALLFEWGPGIIRPASAQTVQQQIKSSVQPIQEQVAKIAATQKDMQSESAADRLERIDQQLLWYRQQNCKAKTSGAKAFYFQKLMELFPRYRELTGADWHMPDCKDVGSEP